MTEKELALRILMLLSAMESWSFSTKTLFPDYLHEELSTLMNTLAEKVLK